MVEHYILKIFTNQGIPMTNYQKLLTAILLTSSLTAFGQPATSDTQTWLDVNATIQITDHWRALVEYTPMFTKNISELGTSTVRSGIGYAIDEHSTFWAGYVAQWALVPSGQYAVEQQSWQGYTYSNSFKSGFNFEMRSRLTERFLPGNSDIAYQGRVRLRGEYDLPFCPDLSIIASNETFVNLNNNINTNNIQAGLNQNQAFVALGYKLTKNVKVEAGYLQQHINGTGTNGDQNNNVFMTQFDLKF